MLLRSYSREESLAVALTLKGSPCGTMRTVPTFGLAGWRCLWIGGLTPYLSFVASTRRPGVLAVALSGGDAPSIERMSGRSECTNELGVFMSIVDPTQPVPPKKKNKAIIIVAIIAGVVLVLFGGCSILVNSVFNKASDAVANIDLGVLLVNPEANSQTGLADGSYKMSKDSSVINDNTCGIYGAVYGAADSATIGTPVTLYAEGAQCESLDTKMSVDFTVTAGVAAIDSLNDSLN